MGKDYLTESGKGNKAAILGLTLWWVFFLAPSVVAGPARLAVVDFKGGYQYDGGTVDGMLVTRLLREELVKTDRVQIVERDLLPEVLGEKKLEMAGITRGDGPEDLALEGVDYLLGGDIDLDGEWISFKGRLVSSGSGVIAAVERISFHQENEVKKVVKHFAAMLAANFTEDGRLLPKQEISGNWEVSSSDNSVSRYDKEGRGGGLWSYKVARGDESYAAVEFDLTGRKLVNHWLFLTLSSEEGLPVYLRIYSFVPGFSREGDDDTLVPVEKEIELDMIANEIPADCLVMQVPAWWREERQAPDVAFNPADIRALELETMEDETGTTRKDKVRIIRVAAQKQSDQP